MSEKKLIINNTLPKIILPKDKAKLFLDWYEKDLYKEDNIPEVFNEGYFIVDVSDFIKTVTHTIFELDANSFATQTSVIKSIRDMYDRVVIHFKFGNNNKINLSLYSETTGKEVLTKEFDIETIKLHRLQSQMKGLIMEKQVSMYDDLVIDITKIQEFKNKAYTIGYIREDIQQGMLDILEKFTREWYILCGHLLISAFWYLATSKPADTEKLKISEYKIESARYDNSVKYNKHKNKVRNITNPVYNFGFIKEIDVTRLISKKKGWKISYEFQVRGHYRHYKSGKTVFIKPYEKGKGLEQKQTVLKLNPMW